MSFANDIKKATDRYKKGFDEVARTSLFKLARGVVLATPKDEGRAQGNWHATIDGYDSTKTFDTTSPQWQEIERVSGEIETNTFYLINNLPYIGKLEYEHPNGAMVRMSIENFPVYLQETINNL